MKRVKVGHLLDWYRNQLMDGSSDGTDLLDTCAEWYVYYESISGKDNKDTKTIYISLEQPKLAAGK